MSRHPFLVLVSALIAFTVGAGDTNKTPLWPSTVYGSSMVVDAFVPWSDIPLSKNSLYWTFPEGSGSTTNDQTSNNNDGTITGLTWSTTTPTSSGYSLYNSGGGLRCALANNAVTFIEENFSLSVWLRFDTINPGISFSRIIDTRQDDYSDTNRVPYLEFVDSSDVVRVIWRNAGSYWAAGTGALSAGTWYHIAFTYNYDRSPRGQIFVNGEVVGTQNSSVKPPTITSARISVGDHDPTSPYACPPTTTVAYRADNFRWYSGTWTNNEVRAIYNNEKP